MGKSGEMAPHTASRQQHLPGSGGLEREAGSFPPRGDTGLRRIWQLPFPPFLFKTTSSVP